VGRAGASLYAGVLAAMPSSDPDNRQRPADIGRSANPIDPPSGLPVSPPDVRSQSRSAQMRRPNLPAIDRTGHEAACYMAIPDSGHSPRASEGGECSMTRPTAKEIKAMADIAACQ